MDNFLYAAYGLMITLSSADVFIYQGFDMKLNIFSGMVFLFILLPVTSQASESTAQAVASWSATAKKDTTSKLVVTPLGSLAFQYAEGIKGFNTQQGLFDVTIYGDKESTAFRLTSRVLTDTLTQLDNSGSTLQVGINYHGTLLNKTTDTTLIDTARGIYGGELSSLSQGFNQNSRAMAQDQFTFSIINGTTDGQTKVTDFSSLPEGIWSGDISVQFNAVWTS